jgi:hypothetical protein
MPRAGAIFKRDMLGIILLGVTLSFTIYKKIGQNVLLSYFLIQKSDFYPKKVRL